MESVRFATDATGCVTDWETTFVVKIVVIFTFEALSCSKVALETSWITASFTSEGVVTPAISLNAIAWVIKGDIDRTIVNFWLVVVFTLSGWEPIDPAIITT
jgi:hypothetical protein